MREVIVQRCTVWIGQRDAHIFVQRFQPQTNAGNRAACASRACKPIDLAAQLLPPLWRGAFDMRPAIGGVVELARADGAVRFALPEFLGQWTIGGLVVPSSTDLGNFSR